MPLPHIKNTEAGNNKFDPMMGSIFEIVFTVPAAMNAALGDVNKELTILTQQVTDVSGLDALQKTVAAGSQKFLGVDVSFLNPVLDNTYAEITVNLNLNLRNTIDAYVLRVFKLWSKLGYDLQSGARTLKKDYVADSLVVLEANRNGVIWRKATFKDVMLVGVTGLDTLDYTNNEARKLQCVFRSDYWDEELASDLDLTIHDDIAIAKGDPNDSEFYKDHTYVYDSEYYHIRNHTS